MSEQLDETDQRRVVTEDALYEAILSVVDGNTQTNERIAELAAAAAMDLISPPEVPCTCHVRIGGGTHHPNCQVSLRVPPEQKTGESDG